MNDMNPYQHPNAYNLCNNVRAYSLFLIHPVDRLLYHTEVITRSLRHYYPLEYPYTWCVYGDYAAIVNVTDLYEFEVFRRRSSFPSTTTNPQLHGAYDIGRPNNHSAIMDKVMILQDLYTNQVNEGSQQEEEFEGHRHQVRRFNYGISETSDEGVVVLDESHFDQISGLSKKLILEKLRVTKYEEVEGEEGEMCVICQMEFGNDESVGVLRCKHRYHTKCIEEWLFRQNIYPFCKGQALMV